MSDSKIKKLVNRKIRHMSEKIVGTKATSAGDVYTEYVTEMNNYKQYLTDATKHCKDCVNPKATAGLLQRTNATSVDANSRKTNLHSEAALASCFEKSAEKFTKSPILSESLISSANAFYRLADAKEQTAEEAKAVFIEPISDLLKHDVNTIMNSIKKSDDYRADYDTQLAKGNNANPIKVNNTQEKFRTSVYSTFSQMAEFVTHEPNHIYRLLDLVSAQKNFYQTAVQAMEDLHTELEEKYKDALEAAENVKDNPPVDQLLAVFKPDGIPVAMPTIGTCLVLYDFEKKDPCDLATKEGDILEILEETDENWILCRKGQEEGLVPTKYVQHIPEPSHAG